MTQLAARLAERVRMRWIVLGFVVLGVVGVSRGDARAAGPATFEQFSYLEAPPPAPPRLPPAPDRTEPEYARKNWEIVPSVGFAAPACRAAGARRSTCDGLRGGGSLGAAMLYRVTPYVALGAELSDAELTFDPAATLDAVGTGRSRAMFFGPLFRGYFTERGSVDPWISLGFGGGALLTTRLAGDATYDAVQTGGAASVGAGVDFWVSPWLKLGPALEQRFVFQTNMDSCRGPGCGELESGGAGGVSRTTRVAVDVTLAFGREM